jgi:N-methylhydantoinase A
MRYSGQRHNIKVPMSGVTDVASIRQAFDRSYRRRYGHADSKATAELQALHLSAITRLRRPELRRLHRPQGGTAVHGIREVYFGEAAGTAETRVYDRMALAPGFRGDGPALIEEYGSTTLVWLGDRFEIGELGEIRVSRSRD